MEQAITYIHKKPIGFTVEALTAVFRIVFFIFKGGIQRKTPAKIPKKLHKEFNIDIVKINGRSIYTFSPQKSEPTSKKHILYIHGGAYVGNLMKAHWQFIAELVRKTNATITVPDYPLAPEHQVKESMAFMEQAYLNVQAKTSNDHILIMGDSAGGGFALAFAQKVKKERQEQMSQIILLSPWLDVSTSDPEIKKLEKKDAMLNVKSLQKCGKQWTGELDMNNELVSPVNGSFEGLGKISVFIGGHDILLADAKKLKNKMTQQNIPLNYFEYPKMFHVWMMVDFIEESKSAINQITQLVKD